MEGIHMAKEKRNLLDSWGVEALAQTESTVEETK